MQSPSGRSVAVLGATGSIGRATLDVLANLGAGWRVLGLSAHSRIEELVPVARATGARYLVASCDASAQPLAQLLESDQLPAGCQLRYGSAALAELAAHPEVDTVVAAIVGSAGVESTLAAARAGKRIALANKESLVVAGSLVTRAAAESGARLIPIDSEHSAIFQALQAGRPAEVERIVLTASGGPFRTWSQQRLEQATVEDALAHPTWQMGKKISVDSATMMNKALEIIEAKWLFGLPADRIDVVVHPQSIVHSMVEFVDGSVVAQLSPPDMRLPIQYALTYPERRPCPCPKMNWRAGAELSLQPVDLDRFPAVGLGWEVARRGGSTGAVLNAANEAAVALFLQAKLRFVDIVPACRSILDEHHFEPDPTLEELLALDRWSRQEIERWAALC
ncbi:MAG: 1-deoxy-D-xylulose-5-phosphate reductoisomerase [Aureliella sp.]